MGLKLLVAPSACDVWPPCFPSEHPCHGASHEEGSDEGGGHEEGWDEEGRCHEVDEGDEGEEGERHRQGHGAKARVFSGKKAKTQSCLTKDKLIKNKRGKVVSKKASAAGKKNWVKNGLKARSGAVKKARKELGLTGFVAIGGKSAAGKALYAKAKSLLLWARRPRRRCRWLPAPAG